MTASSDKDLWLSLNDAIAHGCNCIAVIDKLASFISLITRENGFLQLVDRYALSHSALCRDRECRDDTYTRAILIYNM